VPRPEGVQRCDECSNVCAERLLKNSFTIIVLRLIHDEVSEEGHEVTQKSFQRGMGAVVSEVQYHSQFGQFVYISRTLPVKSLARVGMFQIQAVLGF
jgi:hypothetical protein